MVYKGYAILKVSSSDFCVVIFLSSTYGVLLGDGEQICRGPFRLLILFRNTES